MLRQIDQSCIIGSVQIIFFTDLDGSLLDHHTYDYSPAQPALRELADRGIALVLASSKTGPELAQLRSELALDQWPAIVENGSGELPPGGSPPLDRSQYYQLRKILDQLPASLRKLYTGFGDMSIAVLRKHTGLSEEAALLAQQRSFTEPGLFIGNDEQKGLFVSQLSALGIVAHDGGRFLTLSFGRTKADGLLTIAKHMGAQTTVALGDAPNDRDMLLAATHPVVIRNDHSPDIGNIPGALYTEMSGPAGWNAAVLSLLK